MRMDRGGAIAWARCRSESAAGNGPFGEPLRELQEAFCHLANVSANCKSISAIWRTSPRSARAFPPFGETLRELQEPFRHLANVSAKCKSLSAIWRTSPRTARAKPTFLLPALRRALKDGLFSVNRAHTACYKAQKGATTGVAAPLHIPLWRRGTMSK